MGRMQWIPTLMERREKPHGAPGDVKIVGGRTAEQRRDLFEAGLLFNIHTIFQTRNLAT